MDWPTFALADDGHHLWWWHTCNFEDLNGSLRHVVKLPLGPHGWALVKTEPLTISPSILCGSCGTHGYIRDGRWLAA